MYITNIMRFNSNMVRLKVVHLTTNKPNLMGLLRVKILN